MKNCYIISEMKKRKKSLRQTKNYIFQILFLLCWKSHLSFFSLSTALNPNRIGKSLEFLMHFFKQ